jgi:hypothetical protein
MVKLGSKWFAVLLLATTATVSVAGRDTSPMVAVHERPAGCHQHGTAPVPQPVSYRCCQSGHDSAILQASFTSQLDSADLTSFAELSQILMPTSSHQNPRNLATSSTDPPDTTPLRV